MIPTWRIKAYFVLDPGESESATEGEIIALLRLQNCFCCIELYSSVLLPALLSSPCYILQRTGTIT
jgi:hypothetical protein